MNLHDSNDKEANRCFNLRSISITRVEKLVAIVGRDRKHQISKERIP